MSFLTFRYINKYDLRIELFQVIGQKTLTQIRADTTRSSKLQKLSSSFMSFLPFQMFSPILSGVEEPTLAFLVGNEVALP